MASSSKGQREEGWQTFGPYPWLMRPGFPDPLFPVWRDQLKSLLSPVGIPVFERMRLLEHDDRQISLPTMARLPAPAATVTRSFWFAC